MSQGAPAGPGNAETAFARSGGRGHGRPRRSPPARTLPATRRPHSPPAPPPPAASNEPQAWWVGSGRAEGLGAPPRRHACRARARERESAGAAVGRRSHHSPHQALPAMAPAAAAGTPAVARPRSPTRPRLTTGPPPSRPLPPTRPPSTSSPVCRRQGVRRKWWRRPSRPRHRRRPPTPCRPRPRSTRHRRLQRWQRWSLGIAADWCAGCESDCIKTQATNY